MEVMKSVNRKPCATFCKRLQSEYHLLALKSKIAHRFLSNWPLVCGRCTLNGHQLFKGTVWNNYYWYLLTRESLLLIDPHPSQGSFCLGFWGGKASMTCTEISLSEQLADYHCSPWFSLQGKKVGFLANRRRHVPLYMGLCVCLHSWVEKFIIMGSAEGEKQTSSFIMPSALWEIIAGMSIVSCRTAFNEGKSVLEHCSWLCVADLIINIAWLYLL